VTVSNRRRQLASFTDLFLVSFLVLFFELACIRWFGSTVVFLTFFTNVILLASFLGVSVGCLIASRRPDYVERVIPLVLVGVALASAVLFVYQHFGAVMVDVGGQGSPQQIYFGTEYRARDVSRFVVPIEAVAAAFFVIVALTFVGLGQVLGREFDGIESRVAAYTVNVAGSLAGLGAFAALSYFGTRPEIWFAAALALMLYLLPRVTLHQAVAALASLLVVGVFAYGRLRDPKPPQIIWSPYYKSAYDVRDRMITTNNIGHQNMETIGAIGAAYVLPHALNRDAGSPPFHDVLIIGAGSGNDVAAALAWGAETVDAVEIDRALFELGALDHPNHPYSDPRVTVHIDDGRSFVHNAQRKYDLVVYALVDSLVLQSGYSSIRLESFLFTREAFSDIAAHLKPGGVFIAYNSYRQGWLVGRLAGMMESVFGRQPIAISLPYQAEIDPGDRPSFTMFVAGWPSSNRLEQLGGRFQRSPFWMNQASALNENVNGFGAGPPDAPRARPGSWLKIAPSRVVARSGERIPTDDWPFVYLRDRTIPALNVRGVALVGALSLVILAMYVPDRRRAPNWRMFFLGAGFMLLETKSVVHLALLFGSTWMVNTIVIAAILVMILASNLFVLLVRPRRVWPYYAFVALSLAANVAIPVNAYLSLHGATRILASSVAVFVPIFFAGIVFATAFGNSREPHWDFGSNLAGAMVGGLAETLSLVVGFNNLLVLALVFYVLSAALGPRDAMAPATIVS